MECRVYVDGVAKSIDTSTIEASAEFYLNVMKAPCPVCGYENLFGNRNWQGHVGIVEHRSIIQNITEYHGIGRICNRNPLFPYEKRGKYDTSESPLPEAETWDCVLLALILAVQPF